MHRTALLVFACSGVLLLGAPAAGCSGSDESAPAGGASAGGSSAGGSAAGGSGGCVCAEHGDVCRHHLDIDIDRCVELGENCAYVLDIRDSTCAGIGDGDYHWSPGRSPAGCECIETSYWYWIEGASGHTLVWEKLQWPDCGETELCDGLPFSIVHAENPEPDLECPYQCTAISENPGPGFSPASCLGPNDETCTLNFSYQVLL